VYVIDDKKLAALARKNAAKAANSQGKKGFGKRYGVTREDLPSDEAALKAIEEQERFFKEMKKRDF
jgi:hypothetical protein